MSADIRFLWTAVGSYGQVLLNDSPLSFCLTEAVTVHDVGRWNALFFFLFCWPLSPELHQSFHCLLLGFNILQSCLRFHHDWSQQNGSTAAFLMEIINILQPEPVWWVHPPPTPPTHTHRKIAENTCNAGTFLLHQQDQSLGHGSWDCPHVLRLIQQFGHNPNLNKV